MESNNLEEETNITEECNICYESGNINTELISLRCCMNTKKICIKCIKCLTVALCPYCRSNLDDECSAYIHQDIIARSAPTPNINYINFDPYSFDDFIREEHVIDPSNYNDSRRLRRQMRRLRHEYNQRRYNEQHVQSRRNNNIRNNSSRYHRNQTNRNNRYYLHNESDNMTRLYNNLNRYGDIDLSNLDHQYLFDIDI